jgi:rubrerythrin
MNMRKVLEYALEREREGKAFFENNADRLQNAAATQAFKAIAGEEQKHIEFIQAQLELLDSKPAASSSALPMQPVEYFADRAGQEMIEQTVQESMVADLPVLRMAYLIERDFSEFYKHTASQSEGEAKKVLEMLAAWEAGHERLFKRMHEEAFEKYSGMPWGG